MLTFDTFILLTKTKFLAMNATFSKTGKACKTLKDLVGG